MRVLTVALFAGLTGAVLGAQGAHLEDRARCRAQASDAVAYVTEGANTESADVAYYHAMQILGPECGAQLVTDSSGARWAR